MEGYISVFFFDINTQGYQRFTTNYAGCAALEMLGKDHKECAKLVGVILMHFGQLRAYGQGKPAQIEVNNPGLCVHFNAWHSKKNFHKREITAIITEAIFVKRVRNMLESYYIVVLNNITIHAFERSKVSLSANISVISEICS